MAILRIRGWSHPTGTWPRKVALISLGRTTSTWLAAQLSKEDIEQDYDEVWTLNRGIRVFRHDLCFVLDDLVGESDLFPIYGEILKDPDLPIITSKKHYPSANIYEYPLRAICQEWNLDDPYFHNSVPMILAYALHIGVSELSIYGADYEMSGAVEPGRPNAEYWVGFLRAKGLKVRIAPGSTLCDANQRPWIYGYADQVAAFASIRGSGDDEA